MKHFKWIIGLLLLSMLILFCFNSALAAPIPPYYYKYDYFPLDLRTVYDIYDLGDQILIAASGMVGHVGTKDLDSWTFELNDSHYPIKTTKIYTTPIVGGGGFSETSLLKDKDNKFTFEMNGKGAYFYFIMLLENPSPNTPPDLNKLPIITHPTNSDLKIVVHKNGETLNYDFEQNGGYIEYSFDEQVAYFKKILGGELILSMEDKLPSVISLNQPTWLSKDISLVEGYNKTLQAFIDSEVGYGYLYSQIDYAKREQIRTEKLYQLYFGIFGFIIIFLLLSFGIYWWVKKRRIKKT